MNPLIRVGWAARTLWKRAGSAARGLPDSLRLWGRGLALVMKAAPRIFAIYLALLFVLSLLPIAQVWLSKLVVDALAVAMGGAPGATSAAIGNGQSAAIVLAFLYALTLVVSSGLEPIQQTLNIWLEDRAVAEVDRRLMDAGARLADLVRIERPTFQDQLRLIQDAAFFLPRLPAFSAGWSGHGAHAGRVAPPTGPLTSRLALGVGGVECAASLQRAAPAYELKYEAMSRRSRAAREMNYCARITTEPAAAKEVRVFGLGSFFLRRFRARFETAFAEMRQVRLAHLRMSAAFTALHALALGGGFWYVADPSQRRSTHLGGYCALPERCDPDAEPPYESGVLVWLSI